MAKRNQVLAITPSEFNRITGLAKYVITRNKAKFQWFKWANSIDQCHVLTDTQRAEVKEHILLNSFNLRVADELLLKYPPNKKDLDQE